MQQCLIEVGEGRLQHVRIAAARDLLSVARTGLGDAQDHWNKAITEYETVQKNLAERAEANLNLAMLYQADGRSGEVEALLRASLKRDPDFYPARVTLVQWLEANGRSQEAQVLLQGWKQMNMGDPALK